MKFGRKTIQGGMLFVLTMLLALWHHPTMHDLIIFAIVLITAMGGFAIFSRRLRRISFAFERVLFYSTMIGIASIIIPFLDALVMFAVSLIFDLQTERSRDK